MAIDHRPPAGERHGWSNFSRAVHAVPPSVLQGLMAAALLCVLLPVIAKALHPASWFAAPQRVAAPLAEAADLPRSHCERCGVVMGIRALDLVAGAPASYEFTVRLHDGSLRTSTTAGKASWRVGDNILLVGGPAGL
ncbi:hypothetical protein JJB11_14890 [Ramlibacter ginsenosidimutans]|uniref:Uncharacterized protein n=1 Tax=Ramlibacter ginsenosidimutans TaxID=502333 RepID=A0A934WN78_9BURK|nr:hypothetical protein [Ramlibacter ginsenosidimutans]MBK6007386.1 hypothetical protein [Ramlibacter ginsenosidimutans]